MFRKLLSLTVLLLTFSTIHAQEPTIPIAAFVDGVVTYYDGSGGMVAADVEGGYGPVISPDGSLVAFTHQPERGTNLYQILALDTASGETTVVVEDVIETAFGLTFDEDGNLLYMADYTGEGATISLYRVAPEADATPEEVAILPYMAFCGGVTGNPADNVLLGEQKHLAFELTAAGLLHSLNCLGQGIGLLNLETGEDVILSEASTDGSHHTPVVSPDGTMIAALTSNSSTLTFFWVEDGDSVVVNVEGQPLELAWSADSSSVFYSTRINARNPIGALSEEEIELAKPLAFGQDATYLMNGYVVQIHEFDLTTGSDDVIFTGDAYGIGRLIVRDESLFFSVVPNLDWLIAGAIDGSVTSWDDEGAREALAVEVYQLDLDTGEVEWIESGLSHFVLPE